MTRYVLFLISILLGLTASLYYGWALRPVSVAEAVPSLLREDFKADYALMIAESYAVDGNVDRALEHLAFLDEENSLQPVVAALDFAQEHDYSPQDIALLAALAEAIRSDDPALAATPTP